MIGRVGWGDGFCQKSILHPPCANFLSDLSGKLERTFGWPVLPSGRSGSPGSLSVSAL